MSNDDITKDMTAAQKLQFRFMLDQARQFDHDLRHAMFVGFVIPSEWHGVFEKEAVKGKTRVTIRLDEDLVRFFRKFGPGWQTQLNTVVRAFVKARMAGMLNGPFGIDGLLGDLMPRPNIGDFERMLQVIEKRRSDE